MTVLRVALAGTLFFYFAGCAVQDEPGIEVDTEGIASDAPMSDVDHGLLPVPGTAPESHPPRATNHSPCGAATVTQFETPGGTQITLCVFEDGSEAILETGPIGQPPAVRRDEPPCALDVFLALAPPDLPVPLSLWSSCLDSDEDFESPEPGARHEDATSLVVEEPASAIPPDGDAEAHYCGGAAAAAAFRSERCGAVQSKCASLGGCDYYRCIVSPVGWHQLTCSNAVPGASCAYGIDVIAACDGIVRHKAWKDGNFAGPPNITHDVVQNFWHSIAYTNGNMRFRADAVDASAIHRYCTAFRD